MTFNLFKGVNNKLYVVINSYISDNKHELSIVSIELPLHDNYLQEQAKWQELEESESSSLWWLLLSALAALCGGGFWLWKKRKRSEERRVGKECRSRWSPYH